MSAALLTTNELTEAVVSYLAVVIKNDAVKAVGEADDGEIGWEIMEHYENTHAQPLDIDGDDRAEQLVDMGQPVVQLCAEIAIRTRVKV